MCLIHAVVDHAVPLVRNVREVMTLTAVPEDVMTLMMIQMKEFRWT